MLLQPFEAATVMTSSQRKPTSGMILPMLEQMKVRMHIHEDDSTLIRKSKQAISDDLNKRYLDKQEMLLKCSFLDPRFKDLAWVPEARRADTLEELVSEALDLAPTTVKIKQEPQDVAQSTTTPTQQNPSLPPLPTLPMLPRAELADTLTSDSGAGTGQDTLLSDLGAGTGQDNSIEPTEQDNSFFDSDILFIKKTKATPQDTRARITREVESCREEEQCPMLVHPMEWWRAHSSVYPTLLNVAVRYLMIPATSVPSERVFSAAGNIVSRRRSSLSHDNVSKLLFLHQNYKHYVDWQICWHKAETLTLISPVKIFFIASFTAKQWLWKY